MRAHRQKAILIGLAFSAIVYGPMIFIEWNAVFGSKSWATAGTGFFVAIPVIALLTAIPAGGIGLIVKRSRPQFTFVFYLACMVFLTFIPANWAGQRIREAGFEQLARDARPLVNAIKEFHRENGHPPATLDKIPKDRRDGLPDFRYLVAPQGVDYRGNPWALDLNVSTGAINWDRFIYLPDQNYPERGFGGTVEPVLDWAYVHE